MPRRPVLPTIRTLPPDRARASALAVCQTDRRNRRNRAVWAAYGWDDPDPSAVDEDTILAWLLALSGDGPRA